jgi:CubicO group peptidase (beta-lactamase class C family)
MGASDLTQILEWAARRNRCPGAGLCVHSDIHTQHVVFGLADAATQEMLSPATAFQIGSTTKVMTAVMATQLAAEGAIDLDSDVAPFFSSDRKLAWLCAPGLTPRRLLSHTSGLMGDLFADAPDGSDDHHWLLRSASLLPTLHRPGEAFSYCNLGFVVLGALIENIESRPWRESLRVRIAEQFHLASLRADHSGPVARGHVMHSGVLVPAPRQWLAATNAAAGTTLTATAEDLARFGASLFDRIDLRTCQIETPPGQKCVAFGSGVMLFDWGADVFGHDGLTIGQQAFLRVFPQTRTSVALLANGGDMAGLADDIWNELATITGAAPAQAPSAAAGAPPPSGRFDRANASLVIAGDGLTSVHHESWAQQVYGPTEGPFTIQPTSNSNQWRVINAVSRNPTGLSLVPNLGITFGLRLYPIAERAPPGA